MYSILACATLNLDKGQICYTKSHREWKAVITCDMGTVTGPETYTCQKSTERWTPSFASSCGIQTHFFNLEYKLKYLFSLRIII